MTTQEFIAKYSFMKPRPGYIVLKEVSDDKTGEALIRSGITENRAYGHIIAIDPEIKGLAIGDLVAYNEYEGQELMKWGKVEDDLIIVIKEENILLRLEV